MFLPIPSDKNGLCHPAKEQDVIDLINYAVKNKLQVRVRGAGQSVWDSIYTDGYSIETASTCVNINMELDQLRDIHFEDSKKQVTVGGGINLGVDPFDPSGVSQDNEQNNLLYSLNKHGWGIQNVPDAIHQTIAGYISTGSQAGSMMHSFDDCIVAIRLVDGEGNVKTFNKSEDANNPFYAVGVSMGLLGVITAVTLQCVPAFNIIGQELITDQNECEFNFTGSQDASKKPFAEYLYSTEFCRNLWWPFPTLQRMIAWKAKTMEPADYKPKNQHPTTHAFIPKPYQPVFPKIFGSALPSQVVAGTGFRLIANYPEWLYKIFGNPSAYPEWLQILLGENGKNFKYIAAYLYPLMIDLYFPKTSIEHPVQEFWDYWNGSLPMDEFEFSNNMFNLVYTELWIPISSANDAIKVMNDFYVSEGISLESYYTIEILATKKSNFWMSPSYNGDMVRLNILRFDTNKPDELNYYQQFWDLMKANKIPFTLHWGKYLPPPNTQEGADYLTGQYPKWNDFKLLRLKMDPHNIFLTSYWKEQLKLA